MTTRLLHKTEHDLTGDVGQRRLNDVGHLSTNTITILDTVTTMIQLLECFDLGVTGDGISRLERET